jgi:hypothetical protein
MAYTKYSLTPANNTAAPPDGAPEGMLPSAVNDTMRDMMAQIRDCGDGIRDGTYTMTAPKITGGTITGATFTGNTFSSPVISGGTINNATIGATTASTGAFSTLSATGATTFSGATVANTFSSSGATITGGTINSTAIGGTTAAAGKFTTLEATGVTTVQAGTAALPAITTTGDTNTGIFFSAADTIDFTEGGAATGQFDSSGNFKFNSGFGSVGTAYGCRAWVNFNGSGTVAIRASGNVSSITDNGTGDYTVNFTNAMPDADYAMIGTSNLGTGGNFTTVVAPSRADSPFTSTPTTSSFRLTTSPLSAGAQDATFVSIAVFR